MALEPPYNSIYMLLLKKHKQYVNGVHFDFKGYVQYSFCRPLKSVLKGVHTPTSCHHATAKTLQKFIKSLNE